jgi:hypothetical protein
MSDNPEIVRSDRVCGSRLASGQASRLFPHRLDYWRRFGLSFRAASALASTGCDTVEDAAKLGRVYFAGRPNLGRKTLQELAIVLGFSSERKTAIDAVAAALALTVADPDETREVAIDVLIALRRSGFVVVASRTTSRRPR